MPERILLLTGKLAEPSLRRMAASLESADYHFEVLNVGISVAALMTTATVMRRLDAVTDVDRIFVPGLCAGDLRDMSAHFGVPVTRGPDDLKDLPASFGQEAAVRDLSRYDINIFAEIVDAPALDVDTILERAATYARDGADVIDLGCLPGTPFPGLEEAVRALKGAGFQVSVDSVATEELRRGAAAGADYLLSLRPSTLRLADEVAAVPILIPEDGKELGGLFAAMDDLLERGRPFIADSILDPIHFGFAQSLARYAELRRRYPEVEIMMGTGNLTELTDADTSGMNTLLLGMMSELGIRHLLTTQVSRHARSVVRELDRGRRMMLAAREDEALPRGYTGELMALHEKSPFPYDLAEIQELAARIRDRNYRVQVTEQGIHVYNRDGMWSAKDPFDLFSSLSEIEDDAAHAFYMGVELARAQIAQQLGKRHVQDEELTWGTALPRDTRGGGGGHHFRHKEAGSTLKARRARKRRPT